MSAIPSESNDQVIKGGDIISSLFNDETFDHIVKYDGKKYQFSLKTLSTTMYGKIVSQVEILDNVDIIKNANNKEQLSDENTFKALRSFYKIHYPTIKTVLIYCAVNPQIVEGESGNSNKIMFDKLPIEVTTDLFTEVLNKSGLSEEAAKARKK